MNCTKCNAGLAPEAAVCPACGTPVRDVSPGTQPQTQPGTVPPQGYAKPRPPCGMPLQQQPGYGAPPQGYAPQPGYGTPPQGYAPQPPCGAPPQVYVQQFVYGMPSQGCAQPGYAPLPQYDAQPVSEQKSRFTYQLLSFFVGAFGIGDFYAERIVSGVIHIILVIVSYLICSYGIREDSAAIVIFGFIAGFANGIWALVEVFAVKTDGKGVPMK